MRVETATYAEAKNGICTCKRTHKLTEKHSCVPWTSYKYTNEGVCEGFEFKGSCIPVTHSQFVKIQDCVGDTVQNEEGTECKVCDSNSFFIATSKSCEIPTRTQRYANKVFVNCLGGKERNTADPSSCVCPVGMYELPNHKCVIKVLIKPTDYNLAVDGIFKKAKLAPFVYCGHTLAETPVSLFLKLDGANKKTPVVAGFKLSRVTKDVIFNGLGLSVKLDALAPSLRPETVSLSPEYCA